MENYHAVETTPQNYQLVAFTDEPVQIDYNFDGVVNFIIAAIEDARNNEPDWFKSDTFSWYHRFITGEMK